MSFQEGKIHLYECSQRFKCLRLTAVLAHHSGAIHSVAFASESGHIVSCSDDMTIGVVRYRTLQSLACFVTLRIAKGGELTQPSTNIYYHWGHEHCTVVN